MKPYIVIAAVIASVWGLASAGIWLIETAPWWAGITAVWFLLAAVAAVVHHYLIGYESR